MAKMSLITEYLNRKMSAESLWEEMINLIKRYNKHTKSFLFIYSVDVMKPANDVAMNMEDYHKIVDILKDESSEALSFYLETPGGSGETAEEVAKFIRKKFSNINFVIAGEAKSAGTILTMCGDEISMTETASLGPIDAQVKIGRSVCSGHDYIEWVVEKRGEALLNKQLNPFDAVMVAQISPGELKGVYNAVEFAKELVVEWLSSYKFSNWKVTETSKKTVTEEMRMQRAKEIADKLTDHSYWKTHGRSIKIDALENHVKLRINKIDVDDTLSDIVYRIRTVLRLLFDSTTIYKIFATENNKVIRHLITSQSPINQVQQEKPDRVNIDLNCPQCGKQIQILAKFNKNKKNTEIEKSPHTPFPKNDTIKCGCGFEINISGIRNELETKVGKKIIS